MHKRFFTPLIAPAMMVASVTAQTARVQVIHNAADAAASVVDVWLDDALLIDDFAFRTASPFTDAPACVDFQITIRPSRLRWPPCHRIRLLRSAWIS